MLMGGDSKFFGLGGQALMGETTPTIPPHIGKPCEVKCVSVKMFVGLCKRVGGWVG